MALSTFVKQLHDVTITFKDGTSVTPLSCVCNLDLGDISIAGLTPKLRETVKYERKGKLQTVRKGKRVYPTGKFTMLFAQFSETSAGTLYDFLTKKTGTPYAAAVSTLGSASEVFTCDIKIDTEGTTFGDSVDGTLTLEDCDCTIDFNMGEPSQATVTFEVLGQISGDLAIAEA